MMISNIKFKMFSNKFFVIIIYVFKVGIIMIIFKFLFISSILFFSKILSQCFYNLFFFYIFL